MKIALLGYGKMGKTIEQIAVARGHEIVLKIDNAAPFFFSRTRSRNRMKYFQLFREPIREKNWRISF